MNRTYKRTKRVAWRRIGSTTVVLHLDRRRAFGLNDPAGLLWDALGAGTTLSGLSTAFALPALGEPDSPSAGATECFGAFLADLEEEGLVEVACDGAPAHAEAPGPVVLSGIPGIEWREEISTVVNVSCIQFEGDTNCAGGTSL